MCRVRSDDAKDRRGNCGKLLEENEDSKVVIKFLERMEIADEK